MSTELSQTLPDEVIQRINEEVDEALGLMLSLASNADIDNNSSAETVQLAISTVRKMLYNLETNVNDPKLKYDFSLNVYPFK